MSDLDSLFEELRGQRPPGPFASPEAVRRRGRIRSRRQTAAAAVAVLALAGGGAVAMAQVGLTPSPSPQVMGPSQNLPAPTGGPKSEGGAALAGQSVPPFGVPREWLITPEDLGSDDWRGADHEILEGPWVWAECEHFPLSEVEVFSRRIGLEAISYIRDTATTAIPERVTQVLERYPTPELAAENLSEVQRYLNTCPVGPDPGDEAAPTFYEVVASGFVGDESLLVRVTPYYYDEENRIVPSGHYQYVVISRVGAVVSTIVGDDAEVVQEVAARAAERLR